MLLYDTHWKFWTFSILRLWNQFSQKRKSYSKNRNIVFKLKVLRLTRQHFHTNLLFQKPLLMVNANRMAISRWTYHKERSFASNYFIFQKFCSSLRTLYNELIWCTNHVNIHIQTFRTRWNFIWGCFFPVSILKTSSLSILSSRNSISATLLEPFPWIRTSSIC